MTLRRRVIVTGLAAGVGLSCAMGQPTRPPQKIGYLHPRTIATDHPTLVILRAAWKKLGYIEGESVLLPGSSTHLKIKGAPFPFG